jgi:biofilm PGA synthesis protein PgaD
MHAEALIISRPEWQSKTQRLTSGTLTIIAWATWIYLCLPIITACLWIAGIHFTCVEFLHGPSLISLLFIGLIALLCSLLVASWSSYNYLRFARRSRRTQAETISHEEIGKVFAVSDPVVLSSILRERRMNFYFDDVGTLIRVEGLGASDHSPISHTFVAGDSRRRLDCGTWTRLNECEEKSLLSASA